MNKPLVTIITATYNLISSHREEYFRQCVASVRMQDYPNIEHLIIDGASNDGSVELFKQLGVNYISEPDSGIYNAFNKGIAKAQGKYIAFLNSDDFYTLKDSISLAIDALENKQADFTYGSVEQVDEDKGKTKTCEPFWNGCFKCIPFCHQTCFATKHVLQELGGFNETYRICADFDLILKGILQGKHFVALPQTITAFRTGGASYDEKKLRKENALITASNLDISYRQAVLAVEYGFLPKNELQKFISKAINIPNPNNIWDYSHKRYMRFIRKQIFTLCSRKGKRCFRLLGITFYNEEKI